MRRLVSSQHVWITLFLVVAFWGISPWMTADQMVKISTASLWVVSGVAGPAYLVQAVIAFRRRESITVQHTTFGIALAWMSTWFWMTDRMLWLFGGLLDGLARNKLVAGAVAGAAIGCFYHLTSPGVFGQRLTGLRPRAAICAVVAAVAAGVSSFLILAPPDLTWLALAVVPWLPQ
jgi:hypothetical protein